MLYVIVKENKRRRHDREKEAKVPKKKVKDHTNSWQNEDRGDGEASL